MRIALVQQKTGADREENLARGLKAIKEAAERGAKLAAFAELAFLPFFPQKPGQTGAFDLAETVPGPTTEKFSELARALGIVIVLNLFEREGDTYYDSSPVIDADGRLLGATRMVHVFDAPGFHEKEYYSPGDRGAPLYETAVGRLGVAICYDRHFPEYMRALGVGGADLVVVPQAGAVDEWPEGIFEAELKTAAFQNGYFIALVNRIGEEENVTFAGESFATDPMGRVIDRAPKGEEGTLYVDLDMTQLEQCPARRHFLPDRRPEVFGPDGSSVIRPARGS